MANSIGTVLGFALPILFIDMNEDKLVIERSKKQFEKYLGTLAITGSIVWIAIVIIWTDPPESTKNTGNEDNIKVHEGLNQENGKEVKASLIEENEIPVQIETIWGQMKYLAKKTYIMLLFLSFLCVYGMFSVFAAILGLIIPLFEYDLVINTLIQIFAPIVAASFVFFGTIGAILYSITFLKNIRQSYYLFWIFGIT